MFKRSHLKRSKGFTLIELLIVIAIILILIAIALPNFLEAQIRAKVTKAKGEMRTLETAMYSYYLDWETYPAEHERNQGNRTQRGFAWLTSPIAYVSTLLQDPFAEFSADQSVTNFITYESGGIEKFAGFNECGGICTETWVIFSNGPDSEQNIHGAEPHYYQPGYDLRNYAPTNGTKSRGEILKWGGDSFWIGVAQSLTNKVALNNNPSLAVGQIIDGRFYLHTLPENK